MNIKDWLNFAIVKLKKVTNNPSLEAEILLSYILKKSRCWIISYDTVNLSSRDINILNKFLYRRICHEPIAYLIKRKEFWSLSFLVSCHTLIPRPDTEILVEKTLVCLENYHRATILDLGTGCGSIALALASARPDCYITGVDCVQESINIAKINAYHHQFNNVYFLRSFWFSEIRHKFDIIVSNPPYIGFNEIKSLDKEIFFEPFISLISFNNGLGDIHYIIKSSPLYLNDKGWLVIEHSWKQKNIVQKFFYKYNFININTYQDYSGNDRVTIGQKIK